MMYPKPVSIHLMLLFIKKRLISGLAALEFQYISCCYLSEMLRNLLEKSKKFQYISCCYLSKKDRDANSKGTFQYISCCYLSENKVRRKGDLTSFNTSHVVIYLSFVKDIKLFKAFQYISCCYLSLCHRLKPVHGLEFQYISCCYLSS